MEMKDEWLDMVEDEPKTKKGKKKKKDEEEERKHRGFIQCQIVAMSNQPTTLADYIRNNQNHLRMLNYAPENRLAIRRTIERAYAGNLSITQADRELANRLFGPYIPSKPPAIIHSSRPERPRTLRENLAFYKESTYEAFWNWLNLPQTRDALYHCGFLYEFDDMIENQRLMNWAIWDTQRQYHPEDEQLFSELRALIEEKPKKDTLEMWGA